MHVCWPGPGASAYVFAGYGTSLDGYPGYLNDLWRVDF